MDVLFFIFIGTLFLAFANGANDNFKGVATLYGSRTLSKRTSLIWATLTTLAGSLTAAWLATTLIKLFSGKGLVPDALIADPTFTLAVVLGAGLTVMFAARFGVPISTTHALVGALTGAGLAATSWNITWGALVGSFFWPLLASPFIALALAAVLYRLVSFSRQRLGISKETCVCLSNGKVIPAPDGLARLQATMPSLVVDSQEHCREIERYDERVVGISMQGFVEGLHILSSGAVSFARGLNDTPKIVGVALVASTFDVVWLTFFAAIMMALGGIIGSHRIANTMSNRITPIEHGQGLTANMVTAFLVIVASKWGVPVSTTHVSCGAIFGIGAAKTRGANSATATNWNIVRGILLAWLATLPIAALAAAAVFVVAS